MLFSHNLSWAVFWLQLAGYLAINWTMAAFWYGSSWASRTEWKTQPHSRQGTSARLQGWPELVLWWPPAEAVALRLAPGWAGPRARRGRNPDAAALSVVNVLQICLFAAATTDLAASGRTSLVLRWDDSGGAPAFTAWLAVAYAWENVLEWAWHRAMHLPPLYRALHRIHHLNRSPEPFDDMLIHPAEAVGYYCILYSPAFLFPMHWSAFAAYMAVMGMTGVLDHCGVSAGLPFGLYDSEHHDDHHRLVDVNYGFPSCVVDLACGTFHGTCCGRRFGRDEPAAE